MTERKAWFCPNCQKHHAPHVDTCPGGTGGVKANPYRDLVTSPSTVLDMAACPICNMKFSGAMGYACPRANCPTKTTCNFPIGVSNIYGGH